jgi:hypothetical protein
VGRGPDAPRPPAPGGGRRCGGQRGGAAGGGGRGATTAERTLAAPGRVFLAGHAVGLSAAVVIINIVVVVVVVIVVVVVVVGLDLSVQRDGVLLRRDHGRDHAVLGVRQAAYAHGATTGEPGSAQAAGRRRRDGRDLKL